MAKKIRSITTSAKAAPTFAGVQKNASASTEFNPDYTQTKTDLKRIGTLAGVFFVILVALSFILR